MITCEQWGRLSIQFPGLQTAMGLCRLENEYRALRAKKPADRLCAARLLELEGYIADYREYNGGARPVWAGAEVCDDVSA